MLWVFDLDGVVWLAGNAIPGSAEGIARLRQHGDTVVFVTNNSTPTVGEYVTRLDLAGVHIDPTELATSSQAAASLLDPGSKVAYLGGEGVKEALLARGVDVVPVTEDPVAVVVGRSLQLDFNELAQAAAAIRNGSRFVATNTDPIFPTPHGPEPGAGALVAYLEVGSGMKATAAGKPESAMVELVVSRYGRPDVVVGDSPKTDGGFAEKIGSPFDLVLSGVTHRSDLPVAPAPREVADDLARLVDGYLGR